MPRSRPASNPISFHKPTGQFYVTQRESEPTWEPIQMLRSPDTSIWLVARVPDKQLAKRSRSLPRSWPIVLWPASVRIGVMPVTR